MRLRIRLVSSDRAVRRRSVVDHVAVRRRQHHGGVGRTSGAGLHLGIGRDEATTAALPRHLDHRRSSLSTEAPDGREDYDRDAEKADDRREHAVQRVKVGRTVNAVRLQRTGNSRILRLSVLPYCTAIVTDTD